MILNNIDILKCNFILALRQWRDDCTGNVAIETAYIFPVMMVMLMGSIDIGRGLLVNKKVVAATHITADLIAREDSLDDDELDNYIEAARAALSPYSLDSFGIDIASIRFIDETADPEVQWRETFDMSPNADVEVDAEGLGTENEGVVAVTVAYTFTPQFSSVFTGPIIMQETAFVRGRITSFVQRE